MKTKEELKAFIQSIIGEAVEEQYKVLAKQTDLYRRSQYHPIEREKKKLLPKKPSIFKLVSPDSPDLSEPRPKVVEPAVDLPDDLRVFLNSFLKQFKDNAIAIKVLAGKKIMKKEALELARILVQAPKFPLRNIKRVASLLVLLTAENEENFV